jgi:hypothetical protein
MGSTIHVRADSHDAWRWRKDMSADVAGQVVDLISEWHDGERVAEAFIVVPYDLPRRNCATYFPEANVLVPLDSYADRSNTPTSKSVVIRVQPRTNGASA